MLWPLIVAAAYAPPPMARNSATVATTMLAEGRLRRPLNASKGFIALSPLRLAFGCRPWPHRCPLQATGHANLSQVWPATKRAPQYQVLLDGLQAQEGFSTYHRRPMSSAIPAGLYKDP